MHYYQTDSYVCILIQFNSECWWWNDDMDSLQIKRLKYSYQTTFCSKPTITMKTSCSFAQSQPHFDCLTFICHRTSLLPLFNCHKLVALLPGSWWLIIFIHITTTVCQAADAEADECEARRVSNQHASCLACNWYITKRPSNEVSAAHCEILRRPRLLWVHNIDLI